MELFEHNSYAVAKEYAWQMSLNFPSIGFLLYRDNKHETFFVSTDGLESLGYQYLGVYDSGIYSGGGKHE